MNNIDLLLEKYLTSIKKWGHIIDVYINPTPTELKDIQGEVRFIADAANKKLYIWSAMTALHIDIWSHIKDSRNLYKSPDILTGELSFSHRNISIDAYYSLPITLRQQIKQQDWSFVKIFDLQNFIEGVSK